jgi:hypothetical protein
METSSDKEVIRQQVREQLTAMNVPYTDELAEAYFRRGPSVLAQAVFLHAAWQEVIPPNDHSWIDVEVRYAEGHEGQGAGDVLKRLLALGATPADLSKLVRHMQRETLMGLCGIIDNTPGLFDDPVNTKLHWHLALFENCPAESVDLGGLHEVVEDFDPVGDPDADD